jgi:hypothetical protein
MANKKTKDNPKGAGRPAAADPVKPYNVTLPISVCKRAMAKAKEEGAYLGTMGKRKGKPQLSPLLADLLTAYVEGKSRPAAPPRATKEPTAPTDDQLTMIPPPPPRPPPKKWTDADRAANLAKVNHAADAVADAAKAIRRKVGLE